MDTSLDKFYKQVIDKGQTIPEDILGKIAVSVSTSWTLQGECEMSRLPMSSCTGPELPFGTCWMQECICGWINECFFLWALGRRFCLWLGLVNPLSASKQCIYLLWPYSWCLYSDISLNFICGFLHVFLVLTGIRRTRKKWSGTKLLFSLRSCWGSGGWREKTLGAKWKTRYMSLYHKSF